MKDASASFSAVRRTVKGGALSFFQKLEFTKNKATRFRRVFLNHAGEASAAGRKPETTACRQIQTELCVTLRPLDSFESGGFERVPDLAIGFSVRPSAAASFVSFPPKR